MSSQLKQLTWVRLLMFLREPEAVFWVFVFPVVLAVVLGIAFQSRGAQTHSVGVLTTLGERWVEALESEEHLAVRRFDDAEEAGRKLRSGAIAILIEGTAQPVVRYDVDRPEAEVAWLQAEKVLQATAGRVDPLVLQTQTVTENGSRYIDFLIPGLLGMNLMGTGIWGAGFALVDMRQKKLLKLLMVTPMRRSLFLLSQMLSRFAFLVLEVVVITLFGVLVLGVPFRGSPLLFGLLAILGGMGFASMGLLIASRAKTIEGVSGIMNFVMMPMWLLSGVFFSYERFPEMLHPFIRALPLTSLNDGLRSVMLEGTGLSMVWSTMLVQVGWGVATFLVALKVFRWR